MRRVREEMVLRIQNGGLTTQQGADRRTHGRTEFKLPHNWRLDEEYVPMALFRVGLIRRHAR